MAFLQQEPGSIHGSKSFLLRFPGITEHYRQVTIQAGFARHFARVYLLFLRNPFVKHVKGLLVGGLQSIENESEPRLLHQFVLIKGERAEAHVASNADLLVVPPFNHTFAKLLKPRSDRKSSSVIEDFLHPVILNKSPNFVQVRFMTSN